MKQIKKCKKRDIFSQKLTAKKWGSSLVAAGIIVLILNFSTVEIKNISKVRPIAHRFSSVVYEISELDGITMRIENKKWEVR